MDCCEKPDFCNENLLNHNCRRFKCPQNPISKTMERRGTVTIKKGVVTWDITEFFPLSRRTDHLGIWNEFCMMDDVWQMQMSPNAHTIEDKNSVDIRLQRLNFRCDFKKSKQTFFLRCGVKAASGKQILCSEDRKTSETLTVWSHIRPVQLFVIHKKEYEPDYGRMKTSRNDDNKEAEELNGITFFFEIEPSSTNSTMNALQDYKELFLKHEDCDIRIILKGENFLAHKFILAARNPVFNRRFSMYDYRGKDVYKLRNINPPVFYDFLLFLYTGEVPNFSISKAIELYGVAKVFEQDDLKEQCLNFLWAVVSKENVCFIFAFAHRRGEKQLLQHCFSYFRKAAKDIQATERWSKFCEDYPLESEEMKRMLRRSTSPQRQQQ